MGNESPSSLRPVLVERWQLLGSIIADSLFLVAWLGILWLFDWATGIITHDGPLEWQLAKFILAASTVALILLFLYFDFRTAALRLRHAYLREQESLQNRPRVKQGGTNDSSAD